MMDVSQVISMIVNRFERQGYAQVPGYNRFGFVVRGNSHVVVSRESGRDTKVPYAKLGEAIEAVREDSKVYSEGPSKLRNHGLTHITSPLWALLHLLKLEELRA